MRRRVSMCVCVLIGRSVVVVVVVSSDVNGDDDVDDNDALIVSYEIKCNKQQNKISISELKSNADRQQTITTKIEMKNVSLN